jgi:hypothetical protein
MRMVLIVGLFLACENQRHESSPQASIAPRSFSSVVVKIQRATGTEQPARFPIREVRNIPVPDDTGGVLCTLNDRSGQEDSVYVDCFLKAGDPPASLAPCRKHASEIDAFSIQLPKNLVSVWCE